MGAIRIEQNGEQGGVECQMDGHSHVRQQNQKEMKGGEGIFAVKLLSRDATQ